MDVEAVGNEPGLKAYWKLNETTGQAASNPVSPLQNGRLGLTTGADANDPFWAGAAPDITAPEISGVTHSSITPVQATITWSTDELSDTQVQYGTDATYGSSSPLNQTFAFTHSVVLSNLLVNTTYHYRVASRDMSGNLAVSPDFVFITLPEPDTAPPITALRNPREGSTVSPGGNRDYGCERQYFGQSSRVSR